MASSDPRSPPQPAEEVGSTVQAPHSYEVSVVIPCLNEADTLAICIVKAQDALNRADIRGEIVIADNGSVDGSQAIAQRLNARVVPVADRGYGAALMGGIAVAQGRFVIMGDADDSYDFGEIPKFTEELRKGFQLVQGCRLPRGGGRVLPGAMPFLHRWWGNPMFTWMARVMFRVPIHDIYCGLRGFDRQAYLKLDQRCTGMEFATEMIIKAARQGWSIGEVPITLHPDGRKAHAPHLKTFRDGWRTLRFFLIWSPRWLFSYPGLLFFLIGLAGYALALSGASIGGATLDAHTLVVASLALLVGEQSLLFGVFAKMFTISEGIKPPDPRMNRLFSIFTLERGLIVGLLAVVAGLLLLAWALWLWRASDFGALDYSKTMRFVVPGVTLAAMGVQGIFGSFMISVLGMHRK